MSKALLASSILLGVAACTTPDSVSAEPSIYKIEYQYCIPDSVLQTLSYNPLKRGKCTNTGTSYVWANEPPVAKLFWVFNPGKRAANSRNFDDYEARIKSLGCTNGNGPQQLGWYGGRINTYIDDRFTKETPELEMTYTVEKVETSGNGSSVLLPGMVMSGCQLRQAIEQ